jgi:hypothetical protein
MDDLVQQYILPLQHFCFSHYVVDSHQENDLQYVYPLVVFYYLSFFPTCSPPGCQRPQSVAHHPGNDELRYPRMARLGSRRSRRSETYQGCVSLPHLSTLTCSNSNCTDTTQGSKLLIPPTSIPMVFPRLFSVKLSSSLTSPVTKLSS